MRGWAWEAGWKLRGCWEAELWMDELCFGREDIEGNITFWRFFKYIKN